MIFRCFLTLLASGSLAYAASAQAPPEAQGVLLKQMPVFDGNINDEEWAGVPPITTKFFDDETGAEFGEPLTFWLAYTERGIAFAVRVQDDPKGIKADEYRQNTNLGGNDNIAISIDPFGKGSGFNTFAVNASGANQISISGGRAAKTEWIGSLRSGGRLTPTGWEGELYIPWDIMDTPGAGTHSPYLNIIWNERTTLRRYKWFFNNNDGTKNPRWRNVEIPRPDSKRTLNLLPFGYFGYDNQGRREIINGGLDFKTSLNQKSQLVGTINPDFKNIENQILSLDFSYFERLAGESRPFFLEGQGFRGSQFDNRQFASQRIRTFDAGINTYGNLDDKSTYSLLSTFDFGNQTAVVGTFSRKLGPNLNLSTGYVGNFQDGRRNDASRFALSNRWGDWFVSGSTNFTKDEVVGSGSASDISVNQVGPGTFFGFGYNEVSPRYLPRIGFAPERNYRSGFLYYSFEKPHPRGAIMETDFGLNLNYAETFEKEVYTKGINFDGSITFRNLVDLDFNINHGTFFDQVDTIYSVSLEHPRGDPYRRWSIGGSKGVLSGKDYSTLGLSLSYRPIRRLQLNFSSEWVKHFEEERQLIVSGNYEMGRFESIGGRLVERGGKINWYLSYRKSGNLGAEYFLILGDPNSETFRKQLILKVVFPVSIKF